MCIRMYCVYVSSKQVNRLTGARSRAHRYHNLYHATAARRILRSTDDAPLRAVFNGREEKYCLYTYCARPPFEVALTFYNNNKNTIRSITHICIYILFLYILSMGCVLETYTKTNKNVQRLRGKRLWTSAESLTGPD